MNLLVISELFLRLFEIVVDTGIQIWNANEVDGIEFPVLTPLLPFLQLPHSVKAHYYTTQYKLLADPRKHVDIVRGAVIQQGALMNSDANPGQKFEHLGLYKTPEGPLQNIKGSPINCKK